MEKCLCGAQFGGVAFFIEISICKNLFFIWELMPSTNFLNVYQYFFCFKGRPSAPSGVYLIGRHKQPIYGVVKYLEMRSPDLITYILIIVDLIWIYFFLFAKTF